MSHKRVSFEVAKALKEAGYRQELDVEHLVINKKGYIGTYDEFDYDEDLYNCPSYLDVWLWLWRKKKCNVTPIPTSPWDGFWSSEGGKYDDPEEAIIAAIDHLVDNDLINNK